MKREEEKINIHQALEMFEENIPEIEKAVHENMTYDLSLREAPKPNMSATLFWVKVNTYLLYREKVASKYRPILRAIKLRTQPKVQNQNTITQQDIDRAKEYPIENLLPEPPVRNMARCPLHVEKTASFQIRKDNRFICWGCQAHGDVIDLYQKLNNTPFLEAVRALI